MLKDWSRDGDFNVEFQAKFPADARVKKKIKVDGDVFIVHCDIPGLYVY